MHRTHPGPLGRTAKPIFAVLSCVLLASCTGTSRSQVEVKAPTTNPLAPTTTKVADCAETLPASAQAGQLLMVMVTAPGLAKEAITTGTAGGFGLKGRQSSSVKTEIQAAISKAPVEAFVASDEEGGTVQRLRAALGELPSAATMAKGTTQDAAKTVGDYAKKMVAAGVNMNFAPVADVGSGSGLGTRSFGSDPEKVSGFVTASVTAMQDAGLIATVKHWPGIGGGKTDPHQSLETIGSLAELAQKDMIPFKAAFNAGAKAVMIAHVEVPGLTEANTPASLSRSAITDQLRGRDGFHGLVITDSLGMGAIVEHFSQEEAAEMAITAGADIALLSGADVVPSAHERLTQAISSGRIPPERVQDAVARVLAAKGIKGECPDLIASIATAQQNLSNSNDNGSSSGTGAGNNGSGSTGTGSGTGSGNSGSGSTGTGSGSTGSGSGTGTGSGTGSGNGRSGAGQTDTGINDTP